VVLSPSLRRRPAIDLHDDAEGDLPILQILATLDSLPRETKSAPDATEELVDGRTRPGARLLIFGPDLVRSLPLPEAGSVTFGRNAPADVVLDDKAVSRLHAAIDVERSEEGDKRLSIRDLGSSNGTFVRGQRLGPDERRALEAGEIVEIGRATIVVQQGGNPGAAWTQEVPASDSRAGRNPSRIIADTEMKKLYDLAGRVALSDISVSILGETGVGKEVMAQEVHDRSLRAAGPFLALNCAAISATLLESELFGYEKGAFTGAVKTKPGLLELAEGGTIFLDEIGELPNPTQVLLLRVLEERRVWRVGGVESHPIDVRFVCATHRDLKACAAEGAFRQDLFYRLNGITLVIPPLRRRASEIALLARAFAEGASQRMGRAPLPIAADALAALEAYAWPGNIRELKNVMERAVVLAANDPIEVTDLGLDSQAAGSVAKDEPPHAASNAALPDELEQLERQRIVEALDRCGGNQTRTAEMLGITRKVLLSRLDAYRIPRPRKHRS
jgi:two-component system, NtrC family, response regulator AtoC